MARGRKYIEFEGLFSDSVLVIFHVIRGFADLRYLAAIMEMGLVYSWQSG